jgi:hypothetical protein
MSRRPEEARGSTINIVDDVEEKIEYKINEHGYRSENFNKNNEVLVLGCSQTYGSGMPNEFTWPEIFSNSINKKYSRIAIPGDSINAQVYKAFKYFEEIGNPEVVVGLFPLYRLEYSAVPDKFLSTSSWSQSEKVKPSVGMAFFYEEYLTKLSKAPHDPEYVLPKEFSIFYNFMFIKMLEQYCESHNIKFIWSIYEDEDLRDLMQSTQYVLNNYIRTSKAIKLPNDRCCKEFMDHKLYAWAADYDKKKKLGHWGIHTHRHVSDLFINRYREIEND